jgi:hypothetical protein
VPGPPDRRAERPDAPVLPDAPIRPDSPAAADGRATWSRDDLRERLRQLPPGHPSSLERTAAVPSDQRLPADDHQRSPGRTADRPDREPSAASASDAAPDPDAARSDYWSEVPRLLRTWASHERTWPADRQASAVDRSNDPLGAWRGDGNQYLDPEQHTRAKDVIADVQRAEKPITEHMQEVERDNTFGGWLEGLEYRLKGEDRIKEKIAEVLKRVPDRTAEATARTLPDSIRFTFCFEAEDYTGGYWDVKNRVESNGHEMIYGKNSWRDDSGYRGINTRWVTPDGQQFELQLHTVESFHAKHQVTHSAYERVRNPLTRPKERQQLDVFQRNVFSWLTVPEDVATIPDYRRKDHG